MRTALVRTDRYSTVAIGLHWTIAALVIANLFIGLFHESLLDGVRGAIALHKSIGVTVLALTLARIAWAATHRPPPLPAAVAGWQRPAARAVHAAFYVLLLAMPLSGWAMVSAGEERRPFTWFGQFTMPYLPVSDAASEASDRVHLVLGYLMAVLAVLHAAAAIRHHLMLRDPVLTRMAPWLRARGAGSRP